MARDLIQACRDRNIDCIVAPYEGEEVNPELKDWIYIAGYLTSLKYLSIDCFNFYTSADAQIAYLIQQGIADIVITEDSDLTLFGCTKILFKMDKQGNGKVNFNWTHIFPQVNYPWLFVVLNIFGNIY